MHQEMEEVERKRGERKREACRRRRAESEGEEGRRESERKRERERGGDGEKGRDADPGAFGTIAYPAHLAGAGRGALSAISITNPGGCAFTSTRGRGPAARLNLCCPIF